MTYYITNKYMEYFTVEQEIDLTKLEECVVHDTNWEMHDFVSDQTGRLLQHVSDRGNSIKHFRITTHDGFSEVIRTPVEYFISHFAV